MTGIITHWQKHVTSLPMRLVKDSRPIFRFIFSCLLAVIPASASGDDSKAEFFESRIRPILIEHCYECHNSSDAAEGGFALDYRAPLLEGGDGGNVLVPGDPTQSRLISILRHEIAGLEMPEGGERLDEAIVADFEQWISDGAIDPRDQPPTADEMQNVTSWPAIRERRKNWWSFQPIRSPAVPAAQLSKQPSNHPIDRFINARLMKENVAPAPLAPAEILVRRLYFNLIGLPPTYEQVTTWAEKIEHASAATRDEVKAELVDYLLARPEFGERWARHWMDWIRYAESHGSEGDPVIEQAWQYRDYLVRALNQDVHLDQLIREHVAGDLLENPRINEKAGINESMIGPAHFRMVFHGFAPTDALDERVRFTDDQINAFSKAFLGLTVSCARCHDHKFDPISQADYYAMFGIFSSCRPGRSVLDAPNQDAEKLTALRELKTNIRTELAARWLDQIGQMEADLNSSDIEPIRKPVAVERLSRAVDGLTDRVLDSENQGTAQNPLNLLKQVGWRTPSEKLDTQLEEWSEHESRNYFRRWVLAKPADYKQWFFSGNGLPSTANHSGAFRLYNEGQDVLAQISPAGISANLISTKLAARLSSPDVKLPADEPLELWVLARGGGGASVRYVVQDYPRNGTVYPVRELSDQWQWHRFDVSYWAGDDIHVELSTARDAPLLVKPQERSWFELSECVLATKGASPPPPPSDFAASSLLSDSKPNETTLADASGFAIAQIRNAVTAWQQNSITDSQAILLDQLVDIGFLDNRFSNSNSTGNVNALVEKYRQIESAVHVPRRVPALEESVGRDQRLFIRGNHKQPDQHIPRRFLEVVDATPYETNLSGRFELAENLLREDNPLTRRVMVNRVWHHLFGQGIVTTPDNFGRVGDKPSHPDLLDWLARDFERERWSLKKLIRQIVLSHTWQRDVNGKENIRQIDPENRLLSHANVRRLEAEAIRDSMLAISGRLDKKIGGEPVSGDQPRRSVYVQVLRNSLNPFLRVFDFPEPFSTVGRRDVTNVPAQSLTLMNDPFVRSLAAEFSSKFGQTSTPASDREKLRMMMSEALQRSVSDAELELAADYLTATRTHIQQTLAEKSSIEQQLEKLQTQLAAINEQVRTRLLSTRATPSLAAEPAIPNPYQAWEFDGTENLQLFNGAKLQDGALLVDGTSYAVSEPLQKQLTEKTIEAVVQLSSLDQQGGGVMTVQSNDGNTFDAIVFGEQQPAEWLAGSNGFSRTKTFAGTKEMEADSMPVHIAITYHADGRVIGYRNGKAYGKPYHAGDGPHLFPAQETNIGFGIRHVPAIGNRLLSGRILRAGLYDRALTEDEILTIATAAGPFLSETDIAAAMTSYEGEQTEMIRQEIVRLQHEREDLLGPNANSFDKSLSKEDIAWTEMAHALFTLKEFIYVR